MLDMNELNEDFEAVNSCKKLIVYEKKGIDLLDCLNDLEKDYE